MKVIGKVIETKEDSGTSKAGNTWKKKSFVVEYAEGTVTKYLTLELFGEKRIEENPFRKGQTVEVNFSVESKQWQDRWFTSCSAWSVVKADKDASEGIVDDQPTLATVAAAMKPLDEDSALPF